MDGIPYMKDATRFLFFVCILVVPFSVSAESARDLVASGNQFYTAGEYDKALEAYEKAAAEQPQAGEISFDKGNVYFQKGEYDKAREAYQAAALTTKDLALEAAAHYNLGNTSLAQGQKQLEIDPPKALSHYSESIRHYQEALRTDPHLQEAAQNIEVVRLMMKDLADRIKKAQEAAKEQQNQREDIQKRLNEAIEEQESEIKENASLQQESAQNPQESADGETQQLASDQEKTRQKTQEIADRLKDLQAQQPLGQQSQQQAEPSAPTAQEHLEKAQEAQKSAVENLDRRDLGEAQKEQEKALEHLKEALAKSEDSKRDQGQCPNPQTASQRGEEEHGDKRPEKAPSQDQSGEDRKEDAQPTQQQEAERQMAQAAQKKDGQKGDERKVSGAFSESPENILREEKENRLQLFRVPGGHKPVDKDW
jgi:hypothetical protein